MSHRGARSARGPEAFSARRQLSHAMLHAPPSGSLRAARKGDLASSAWLGALHSGHRVRGGAPPRLSALRRLTLLFPLSFFPRTSTMSFESNEGYRGPGVRRRGKTGSPQRFGDPRSSVSSAAVTFRARFTLCSVSRRSQSRLSEAPCGEPCVRPGLRRDTCCGSEPCERRVARDRRETASAGPSPAQATDLRLLQPEPGAAVSRAVERFAEQRVSRREPQSVAGRPTRPDPLLTRCPLPLQSTGGSN
jgi:hypothetical protein